MAVRAPSDDELDNEPCGQRGPRDRPRDLPPDRRRRASWLPVEADWSEEGRENGVLFQVRDGIKYWCESDIDSEPDSEDVPDPDGRAMDLGFMCCDRCHRIKPPEQFHESMKEKWNGRHYDEVLCLACTGSPAKRSEDQSFRCHGRLQYFL